MCAGPERCPRTSQGRLLGTAQHRPPEVPEREADAMIGQNTDLTNKEGTTHCYIQEFTNSLNDNQLINILLFIAGSVHPPSKITVMFNVKSGIMRCPNAHTCSNILELSSTISVFRT